MTTYTAACVIEYGQNLNNQDLFNYITIFMRISNHVCFSKYLHNKGCGDTNADHYYGSFDDAK